MTIQPRISPSELSGLLEDATEALAHFDAECLNRLNAGALKLQALRELDGIAAEEAWARLRVFASVLRATGNGLQVLRRVSDRRPGPWQPQAVASGWQGRQPANTAIHGVQG